MKNKTINKARRDSRRQSRPALKITTKPAGGVTIEASGVSDENWRYLRLRIDSASGPVRCIARIDNLGGIETARLVQKLNQAGAHLISSKAKNELLDAIQMWGARQSSFRVVTNVGPSGGQFVLPGEIVRPKRLPKRDWAILIADGLPAQMLSRFIRSGTMESWQELFRLAERNSRLLLALLTALQGPMRLGLPEFKPASVQFVGTGGGGKTVVAMAGGSVWGANPDPTMQRRFGFGDTWSTTINGLEDICPAVNGTVLVLDETRLCDPAVVVDAVFRLESGVERGRKAQVQRRIWCVPVLSTSNVSLAELAVQANKKIDQAYTDRLMEVPYPKHGHGIFEDLCGFETLGAMGAGIGGRASTDYGLAGPYFVRRMVQRCAAKPDDTRKRIVDDRNEYMEAARTIEGGGRDIERVHQQFASLYATGCMTRLLQVHKIPRATLLNLLLQCERDHLDFVAHVAVMSSPREQLRDWVAAHRASFIDLDARLPADHDPARCRGYVRTKNGRPQIILSNETLTKVVEGVARANALKSELVSQRQLAVSTKGIKMVQKVQIGRNREQMLVFEAGVFD